MFTGLLSATCAHCCHVINSFEIIVSPGFAGVCDQASIVIYMKIAFVFFQYRKRLSDVDGRSIKGASVN